MSGRTDRMFSVESSPAIPEDIREVIEQFFRTYHHFKGARQFQTDTFIKEVFYATKQDPKDQRSIEEMEAYIQRKNVHRLRLKSYVIDEYLRIGEKVCMIGVTREFSNAHRNRVLYFIIQEDGVWRFHHIVRSLHGKILEKFQVKEQMGFVVGDDKVALLFLTHADSADATSFILGDYVHMEGFLEVEQEVSGQLFYRVVRMNRVH
ncbi:hypothetical protein [Paenibacillus pectinilyticus]|uniref:hypothetical protein n=1 Tax=Paenibacillus pectinilyticus TaxID=512399 RepID=UPI001ABFE0E8|nr:hypothetical protein [Paenibacillus pectinilyticus]